MECIGGNVYKLSEEAHFNLYILKLSQRKVESTTADTYSHSDFPWNIALPPPNEVTTTFTGCVAVF